jgi:signal transduction histidine kinase
VLSSEGDGHSLGDESGNDSASITGRPRASGLTLDKPIGRADHYRVRPLFNTRVVPLRELLSLRFRTPRLEIGFSQYYLPISLFQSRLAFGLAFVFLSSDYVADSIYYGLSADPANLLRVALLAPAFLCFFFASYRSAIKRRYELYVSVFYSLISICLFYVIFLLDEHGNGISNVVGFLNYFFILLFGFVLIGTRFYYSCVSSTLVSIIYIVLLYHRIGAVGALYYFSYQIFTIFSLCALLGYTRELVLRADFATQFELAEAQKELAQEREALARQHQSDIRYLDWLRQLAQFLRHEVRVPVAQITSSIELIQLAHNHDDKLQSLITNASLSARDVWNLVERASQATDAEAYVRQSVAQPVELQELLRVVVATYRQSYSGIDFQLQSQLQSAPICAQADPLLIKEAVGNLLANAASFADEESIVLVVLKIEGAHAAIAVSNKGPLIEGDTEALFGPFASTRLGPTSEHQGLGLYLVRLIAEKHGGTAAIRNLEDGSGVQASIVLPLVT